ncbi:hypothetical protein FRX31_005818 [Thalictrum thalictroides]|uniref:Uncharacterized protein n=1 Tax=Thalictrum thalictroides TaxID=46969 RepID=A0A7J6X6X1_THATH|nr:hypothetical protein FRX31_005818 [Thalictrum thalictroides]
MASSDSSSSTSTTASSSSTSTMASSSSSSSNSLLAPSSASVSASGSSSSTQSLSLHNYIDNEVLVPPKQIIDDKTNTLVKNPEFTTWHKVDQMLLSWIRAKLTQPVLGQVASLSTSREVWHSLEASFASQNQARVLQLRLQLQTIKKGSLTMTEYVDHVILLQ